MDKLRIDKWLWAARLYKTRSLAKQAIESGRVRIDGQRIKASKEISCGVMLSLRRGFAQWELEVLQLSAQRRGADIAQTLYRETAASAALRAQRREEHLASHSRVRSDKPNKKQRRQIHRFVNSHNQE